MGRQSEDAGLELETSGYPDIKTEDEKEKVQDIPKNENLMASCPGRRLRRGLLAGPFFPYPENRQQDRDKSWKQLPLLSSEPAREPAPDLFREYEFLCKRWRDEYEIVGKRL